MFSLPSLVRAFIMSVLFEISFENLSAPNSFLRLKCEMIGEKRKLKIGEKSTKKMMILAPFCPSPIASYALMPTFSKMKIDKIA